MKLDHDFFVARYRALGTDELFEQLHGVELSDTALAALTAVLVERGMSDDDMLARHRAATRTRIPSARAQNLCDNCGRSLAGGMIEECGSRLCSAECVRGMRIFDRSKDIDVEHARALAAELRSGECPRCGRSGDTPEMRRAHYIYSYIKGYSEAVETRLCCRRCGRNSNLLAILGCVAAGWWSLPGLLLTPGYVVRNLLEIRRFDKETAPSPALVECARSMLAAATLDEESGGADHVAGFPKAEAQAADR